MNNVIQQQIAALLSAKTSHGERDAALQLREMLVQKHVPFSLTLRTVNGIDRLNSQQFLAASDRIALIRIGDDVYAWRPVDPVNTDMFFLE